MADLEEIGPGYRFHRWTVLRKAQPTASGRARWTVRCRCGHERVLEQRYLREASDPSTGCNVAECRREWEAERVEAKTRANMLAAAAARSPDHLAFAIRVTADATKKNDRVRWPTVRGASHRGGMIRDRIERSVDRFIAERKIRPEHRAYFVDGTHDLGHLHLLEDWLESAPHFALSQGELEACRNAGITDDEYREGLLEAHAARGDAATTPDERGHGLAEAYAGGIDHG